MSGLEDIAPIVPGLGEHAAARGKKALFFFGTRLFGQASARSQHGSKACVAVRQQA